MVQMPAVNTPQFDWVLSGCRGTRSRYRRSTSPRSPLAPSRTRGPSAPAGVLGRRPHRATLAANALAPGLLDRYLGTYRLRAQQTESR